MKFSEALNLYMDSPKFSRLAYNSKVIYTRASRTLAPFNNKPIESITRPAVIKFADGLQDTPGKGRAAIAVMSNVFQFCYDRGYVTHNPAHKVEFRETEPIQRWEESEIKLFLDTATPSLHAAMMLAFYTGQRVSDLVRIRWADYDGEFISLTQKKTRKELVLAVHPALKADLDIRHALDRSNEKKWKPFVLTNAHGRPWTAESLRRAFERHAKKIGLKNRSIHGVRKTTAAMLAEKGCTPHQIRAITGHMTLKEVERYTLEAKQKELGVEAIRKLSMD